MRYKAPHVIHMLVMVSARLERRVGLVRSRSPAFFDEELGRISAHMLYVTSESVRCFWLATDVFYRYCSRAALKSLCLEGEGLGAEALYTFDAAEPLRVVEHPAYGISGRVHLKDVFSYGAHLGWAPHWCPFVGPAAVTWFEVFGRHPSHETWERWVDELLVPDLESLTH